ncbi:hypothetical protein FGO68_gene12894 [Halteria grandinella]|uniref:Uncharacterized protein n=1 Tax=Halteria grandinella TaxID=5974 RepID=A0A8J8NGZ7_HALGN|nr:hypothetical protein FGO68_gene12894 [Halteria grandinella]
MSEKLEARHDKDVLTEKYITLEAKFNETLRNEKLLSERFKSLQSEKERQELEFQEKAKKAQHELHSLVSGFESRVRTLESQLKVREEESFKKSNEHMKLQALIEQKLQLTEKELYECKAKYNLKDQDYKEVNKELYQVKKENQAILSQVQKVEQDKHDELRALKEEHEVVVKEFQRQINAGITGNPQVSEDLQQQWNKERQQLNDQLKSLSEGLVAQKQFQEHLMKMLQTPKEQQAAVGTPEKYKNKIDKQKKKNADLQGMNQSLTQQIVQMQSKQQQLEKLVSTMKQYKYLLHQAIAIQCKSCNKLYPKNQYQEHIPECNREIERVSTLNAQQSISPIQVQIQTCILKDNFISYELNIEKCFQCWRISKNLEAFKAFFDELYLQFPTYSHIIPFIQDEWLDLDKMGKEFYYSELKQILQKLINDLVSVPFIRENVIFKQFLEFEGNYMDDSNFDKRRTIIQNNYSGGSILYGNITSQAGRQSVLNPFNIANPSNSGLKQASVGDGKRSVSPLSGSQMLYAQNKINESAQRTYSRYSQMPYSTAQMIQELADDEDYSSLASKSRVSMPNGDESNRVSTVSQRLVTYNSREPTVAEYVPYYSQNVEKAEDEEFGGVPLVEVLLDTVQNTGTIQSDTFTEVFRSNPRFPRPQRVHDIDDDSFSENLEGVTLSPRRMSSQLENPMLDGSPNGTDLQHTKTNLINKFYQEQKQTEGLSAHQNFAPTSTLSSARKQLNSRYEALERSEEL